MIVRKFKLIPKISNRQLPVDITKDCAIVYSPGLKRGTKSVARPIPYEVEEQLLPSIIGVSPKSEIWASKVLDFWSDFTVNVPATGKTINGSYEEKEGRIIPEEVNDYLFLESLLQDDSVAKSEDDAEYLPYYLVDEEKDKKFKMEQAKSLTALEKAFLALLNNPNKKPITYILNLKKSEIGLTFAEIGRLNDEELEYYFRELKNKLGLDLLPIINDEHLKEKSFIYSLVDAGIISVTGETYIYNNIILGESLNDTVIWIKSPSNSAEVQKLQASLSAFKSGFKNK